MFFIVKKCAIIENYHKYLSLIYLQNDSRIIKIIHSAYYTYLNLFFCIARSVFNSSVRLCNCLRFSSEKIKIGSSDVLRISTSGASGEKM